VFANTTSIKDDLPILMASLIVATGDGIDASPEKRRPGSRKRQSPHRSRMKDDAVVADV
jgi:hypothetical protein